MFSEVLLTTFIENLEKLNEQNFKIEGFDAYSMQKASENGSDLVSYLKYEIDRGEVSLEENSKLIKTIDNKNYTTIEISSIYLLSNLFLGDFIDNEKISKIKEQEISLERSLNKNILKDNLRTSILEKSFESIDMANNISETLRISSLMKLHNEKLLSPVNIKPTSEKEYLESYKNILLEGSLELLVANLPENQNYRNMSSGKIDLDKIASKYYLEGSGSSSVSGTIESQYKESEGYVPNSSTNYLRGAKKNEKSFNEDTILFNCHTKCHSRCHSSCHGSRGWR